MTAEPRSAYLRIGELAARANVSVSTIKYYIREGLLPPPPVKTGRTMGYYDEAYLERLQLIRRLREEHFLPVRVIRAIVADRTPKPLSAREASLLSRLAPAVVQQLVGAGAGMSLADASRRFNIPPDHLALLQEMGLIADGGGQLDSADVELLDALARAEAAGLTRDHFPIEGLGNYVELLGELARREVRTFTRQASEIPDGEVDRLAATAVEVTQPVVAAIRKKLILRALRAELENQASPTREIKEEEP